MPAGGLPNPGDWPALLFTYGPFGLIVLVLFVAEGKARGALKEAPPSAPGLFRAVYFAVWIVAFLLIGFAAIEWDQINVRRQGVIEGTFANLNANETLAARDVFLRRDYSGSSRLDYEWRLIRLTRLHESETIDFIIDQSTPDHEKTLDFFVPVRNSFYASPVDITYDRTTSRVKVRHLGEEQWIVGTESVSVAPRSNGQRFSFLSGIAYAYAGISDDLASRLESNDVLVRRQARQDLADMGASIVPAIELVLVDSNSSYRLLLGALVALDGIVKNAGLTVSPTTYAKLRQLATSADDAIREAAQGCLDQHFMGDSRCGNPTCHGAGLPTNDLQRKDWMPWKSARTQWLNRNLDHHSRAYATLGTSDARTLAARLAVDGTTSDRCLCCHAPQAAAADGGANSPNHRDGVTCEHCHGPAEFWFKPHLQKDFAEKRAQFSKRGFNDLRDFKVRAEKCASCHVEIDHEITAAGHPPMQFDLIAYAQIMKHWDDQRRQPPDSFSIDPTIWSVGQIVGLSRTLDMIARRVVVARTESSSGPTSLAQDLPQASGYYQMVNKIVSVVLGKEDAESLRERWTHLAATDNADPEKTLHTILDVREGVQRDLSKILARRVDRNETVELLKQVTSSANCSDTVPRITPRPIDRMTSVHFPVVAPWWCATQTILAVQALCEPAFGVKCRSIEGDLRHLLQADEPSDYRPDLFLRALRSLNQELFGE